MSHYYRTQKKQKKPYGRIILITALVSGSYLLWANASTTNPAQALADARSLIEDGKFKQAESLLAIAKQEKAIEHWALIEESRLLEKTGRPAEAAKRYGEVSMLSPASLSARLALIRLREHVATDIPGSVISKLESDIARFGRSDLLPELALLQAREAERAKDWDAAFSLYQKVRERFPHSSEDETARAAMAKLRKQQPKRFAENSLSSLLDEARMLLREGEITVALDAAQQAKSRAVEKSPGYIEALAVEERALRLMKRNEEADHVLLMLSADGAEGIADEALLRIASNAWNVNDHSRALEFLDKLSQRFPRSNVLEQAGYVEARILEEMKLYPEAKDRYQKLIRDAEDGERKAKALKRLAWLYYRNENPVHAAKTFQTLLQHTRQQRVDLKTRASELSENEIRVRRDQIETDENHAAFWLASVLGRVKPKLREEHELDTIDPNALLERVQTRTPFSFYSLQAAKAQGGTLQLAAQSLSEDARCLIPLDGTFIERLKRLSSFPLRDLARYEIDWYAAEHLVEQNYHALPAILEKRALTLHELKGYSTVAELYKQTMNPKHSIGIARTVLRAADSIETEPEEALWACRRTLLSLSFPTPYQTEFKSAAAANELPVSLLYAIARTESHFDPRARSRTGAAGLTQLMPATAKQEGWDGKADLYLPGQNISLGAKHLARLIRNYDGEAVFAIAAYNAGGSAINRWRSRYPDLKIAEWMEMIGYPETYNYVQRVLVAQAVYEQLLKPTNAG